MEEFDPVRWRRWSFGASAWLLLAVGNGTEDLKAKSRTIGCWVMTLSPGRRIHRIEAVGKGETRGVSNFWHEGKLGGGLCVDPMRQPLRIGYRLDALCGALKHGRSAIGSTLKFKALKGRGRVFQSSRETERRDTCGGWWPVR